MAYLHPTPVMELNKILASLVSESRLVLRENFLAAYLLGSFAVGDWDKDSDVDFMVVTEHDLSLEDVIVLEAMHTCIFATDSYWAKHLEGTYFPREWLKRLDDSLGQPYYLDNGSRELVRSKHDNELVVRWVARERGITLAGPSPSEFIDPMPASELCKEVLATMHTWAGEIKNGSYSIDSRWAQPFTVLSYCRMLHTLSVGRVESKPAGARWALAELDSRCWAGLIQRALDERPDQYLKCLQVADPMDVHSTLEFINYTLALSKQYAGKFE